MIFDPTINIGTLLVLVSMVVSSFFYVSAMLGRFTAVISRQDRSDERDKVADEAMREMKIEVRKQTDMLVAMARYEEQMNAFQERLSRVESDVHDSRTRQIIPLA